MGVGREGGEARKFASDVEMHNMVSFPAGSQGRGDEGWVAGTFLSYFLPFESNKCAKSSFEGQ